MKNINKICLMMFILVTITIMELTFIKADLGCYKQNDCIPITTVLNSSSVNISVLTGPAPNPQILLINVVMNKTGSMFNYSFCNTSQLGTYNYGYCDNFGNCYSNSLTVTYDGTCVTTGQGLLEIIVFFGLLIILFFTVYGAIIFPWKNNRDEDGNIVGINDLKYLKVALWIFAYLEFFFILTILQNISGQFLTGFYQFFNIIWWFMLILMLPFFPVLIAYTIIIWLEDKKTQKNIKRGIPMR